MLLWRRIFLRFSSTKMSCISERRIHVWPRQQQLATHGRLRFRLSHVGLDDGGPFECSHVGHGET